MRKACYILISLAGAALFTGCNQQSAPGSGGTNSAPASTNSSAAAPASAESTSDTNIFANDGDRESYAIGMLLGTRVKGSGASVNDDMVARGVKDTLSGHPALTEQQERLALNQFQASLMAQRNKMQQQQGEKNRQEGAAFLAQNSNKPGVVTATNGIQWLPLNPEGTGASPDSNDLVTVNYSVSLLDGTEIDNTHSRPVDLPVSPMIPGWSYVLPKMKVGDKWRIWIPSNLGYGPMGRPPRIGPDETLIFEVELLGVKARPAPAPVQPLTSDIIKVPSAEDMKKGAKIETIKASDLQKMEEAASNNAATNGGK